MITAPPGVILMDSPEGLRAIGPNGAFLFENAHRTDEVVAIENVGRLNVTIAKTMIPDDAVSLPLPIDQNLRDHIAHRHLDEEVLNRMTAARLEEPVIMMEHPTGMQLIDGVHRLTARIRKGLPSVQAHILIGEAMPVLLIRCWKLLPDGAREEAHSLPL